MQAFRNISFLLQSFSTEVESHAFIAEEALRLLLVVATNRSMFGGKTLEQIAEEWVITRLACGPLPFSRLSDLVPESISGLRNFQAIVEKVATFQKPKGTLSFVLSRNITRMHTHTHTPYF